MKKCSLFFVREHFFIYDNLIFRICIAMPKPAKRKRRKPLIKYQIVPLPPVLGNSGRFRLKIVTLAFSQSGLQKLLCHLLRILLAVTESCLYNKTDHSHPRLFLVYSSYNRLFYHFEVHCSMCMPTDLHRLMFLYHIKSL